MNKIICDVCGTDYPETAAQCPICGCASAGAQTSAGNEAADAEEKAAYTPVKGGRFSKANVRKRLKNSQMYYDPIPESDPEPEYEDDENQEEEEEEEERGSNRGLVIVIAILLLAIVAVATYIAISIFGLGNKSPVSSNKPGTTPNAAITMPTTEPVTDPTTDGTNVACVDLRLNDVQINLTSIDTVWQLKATPVPDNTTDVVYFVSSDLNVVTVDQSGLVTAVGTGEAYITITCGEVTKTVDVVCGVENTDPTDPAGPTDPTDPTDPTETPDGFVLKLNRKDFTLNKAGDTHDLYDGEVDPADITWKSLDEDVVTVKDGIVTAVGKGRTRVIAEYGDQEVSCWVTSNAKKVQETEPTEPDTTEPEDGETASYTLLVNGRISRYGDEHNADVTITVDGDLDLVVVDEAGANQNVTWTASKEGICSVDGRTVTGESVGNVTLTATIDGQTFKCIVRVQ